MFSSSRQFHSFIYDNLWIIYLLTICGSPKKTIGLYVGTHIIYIYCTACKWGNLHQLNKWWRLWAHNYAQREREREMVEICCVCLGPEYSVRSIMSLITTDISWRQIIRHPNWTVVSYCSRNTLSRSHNYHADCTSLMGHHLPHSSVNRKSLPLTFLMTYEVCYWAGCV